MNIKIKYQKNYQRSHVKITKNFFKTLLTDYNLGNLSSSDKLKARNFQRHGYTYFTVSMYKKVNSNATSKAKVILWCEKSLILQFFPP